MQSSAIHVVSKADNHHHAVVNLPPPLGEGLPVSSILVRPILLGLTSNNLAYARGGDILHWWKTYVVPATAPFPYDDQSSWGIVPAWGYATVTESNISGIQPNSIIWGYLPTSTSPTLLMLEPSDVEGHWVETSIHRQQLMPIYNRYEQVHPGEAKEPDEKAWNALFRGVWLAGYLLSEYVFSADPLGREPVHPLGAVSGITWDADDADLSSTVVVILGASSKVARSFSWCLFGRSRASGPLGLVQVTSAPDILQEVAERKGWGGRSRALTYENIDEATEWIEGLKPSKVLIVDCGARDNILSQLCQNMKQSGLQLCKTVYTTEEVMAARAAMQSLGKIQYNTSAVQDTLIEREGAQSYFGKVSSRWNEWLADRASAIPDMHLVWGQGMEGENGIYGGWEKLSNSMVRPDEGLAYVL
ncbi:hypothetical protein N8T08_008798 [Aspergillus melleus]|uniref:Uncharacterized protein n=1 Tax=Aspergillus melleus TaxID=138277 RepID=A0ACC3AV20_9EURO|nr:hypothetical protein N8T08_008798 [Aspergillus melleus]